MDDLISRQDAIGKIKDWMKFIGYSHSERNVMECTIQMLEELPAAEPVQKTGKWIHCKYPLGECSLCHKIINIQANEADYCPCCGSKNTGYEWL